MKTFQKVIDDAGIYGAVQNLNKKPVFRSSAIFPVMHNEHMSTNVLFMGYWILKREIMEIGLVYTLRDQEGKIVSRQYTSINTPKARKLSVKDILQGVNYSGDFTGSLEMEVFSTKDMVFPYPAFVLEYYNPAFSSVVHTTGRVYNDFEDFKDNDDFVVPESGFDIYGSTNLDPFFAFVNGPLTNNEPVRYEVVNSEGKVMEGTMNIGEVKPYETKFVHLNDHIEGLSAFLGNKPGSVKLKHNFKGFFPRLLAGNFDKANHTCSITHTFYDCSSIDGTDAYWKRASNDLYDSSIYAPVFLDGNNNTEVVFYPIYSPSVFSVNVTLLDEAGNELKKIDNYKVYDSSTTEHLRIDAGQIAKENNVDPTKVKGIFVSKTWTDTDMIPNRLKFGLNVKSDAADGGLSSNICFNSHLGLPKTLQKTGTRKWAPFVNNGKSVIVIDNASTQKDYNKTAKISYKIFREEDDSFLEREETIAPMGQTRIEIGTDGELSEFVKDKTAWIYIDADSPFVNAWYFNFGKSGVVGADHSF